MASRGCVIFVGNLPGDVREREIEDLFYKYGRIRNIDLKLPPRPPAFAFVEFENPRDAEDAVKGRDGYMFDNNPIRVELSRGGMGGGRSGGMTSGAPPRDRDEFRGGGGGGGGGGGAFGRSAPPPVPSNFRAKGSAYRAMVKNLPMSASWQDLKDHFRKVCTPNYVNVFRDRGGVLGVVEFDSPEDLARAIRKLDDTEFRNPFERAYIRVVDDSDATKGGGGGRGRSRSRSRDSRSYSRSRSRSGSDSRSRSRSRSSSRSKSSKSRSASKSRSRSKSVSDRSDRSAGEKKDEKDADVNGAADKDDDKADEAAPMDHDKGNSPAAANGADHKAEEND